MKIILEGTDGVGKTSTIKKLKEENIICEDRSKDIISKYMMFDVDLKYRVNKYYKYLKNNDVKVIFMINNDKEELMRRIYKRKKISDFDLKAYEYNNLYKETFNYMKDNNLLLNKLYMVDVTGLGEDEQTKKIKNIIIKWI